MVNHSLAPQLIALDWGTTSLRAYLVDQDQTIIDSVAEPKGILNVTNGDFESVFEQFTGPWLAQYGSLPALACGMIGSRQGWREAPYIACPAGAAKIAAQLSAITTRSGINLYLVPGVSYQDAAGVPDVIRGEETQIMGQLSGQSSQQPRNRQIFVLPGTHSKWVLVEQNRIAWFATFISGELFAVLSQHSILGRLMDGSDYDAKAFHKGLDYAAVSKPGQGGLLKRLFSARTLGLFDKIPATGLHSYLSGLIIGSEIGEGLACLAVDSEHDEICVIGNSNLSQLYLDALQQRGLQCQSGVADAVVAGLYKIAENAGLVETGHD